MKLKKLAIRENVEENKDDEEEAEEETDKQKEEKGKSWKLNRLLKEKWRNMMVFTICDFFVGLNSLEYYTKIVNFFFLSFCVYLR